MAGVKTDTFVDYLKTWRLTRDAFAADFVAGVLMVIEAGTFPKVETWDELHIHLHTRNASVLAIEGVRRCWRNFERLRRLRSRTSS